MTTREILDRLVTELTRVVGALIETSASSRPGVPLEGEGFLVFYEAGHDLRGRVDVWFGRLGAESLAKALSSLSTDPSEAQVLESLKEICGQAVSSFDAQDAGCTLRIVGAEVAPATPAAPDPDAVAIDIVMSGHERPLHVVLSGHLDVAELVANATRASRAKTLDVIMDIDLPLVVRFGRTELPLKTLTALGPGSVIDLGRSPDDPVDVLISNRVVARGDVVIVSGNYGVRVRDVVSPAERARSLEAELS